MTATVFSPAPFFRGGSCAVGDGEAVICGVPGTCCRQRPTGKHAHAVPTRLSEHWGGHQLAPWDAVNVGHAQLHEVELLHAGHLVFSAGLVVAAVFGDVPSPCLRLIPKHPLLCSVCESKRWIRAVT